MQIKRQLQLLVCSGSCSLVHRLDRVRANILLLLVSDFLYRWEILLRRIEVVYCHLVHGNVHYGAVTAVPVATRIVAARLHREVRLANGRRARPAGGTDTVQHAAAVLFLDFFTRLEDRWQQRLVLHERAIMVVFAYTTTLASCHATFHVVFEVRVERLMLAVFNLEVRKVTARMLRRQGTLLHVDIMVAFRLFLFWEPAAEVIAELALIEGAVRCVVRDLTHALAVYRH